MIDWAEVQKGYYTILSVGLRELTTAQGTAWGSSDKIGPGVYLFRRGEECLYIGEAIDLARRLKSQWGRSGRSRFLKSYGEHRSPTGDAAQAGELWDECRSSVTVQTLTVAIGRKELEEYGISALPTTLNRMHRGVLVDHEVGEPKHDLWTVVQGQSPALIDAGRESLLSSESVSWFAATPPDLAGLYLVTASKGESLYVGETTSLAKRHKTHSRKTYFSALRRNVGREILGAKYIGKRKFTEDVEKRISAFLEECELRWQPITFGRREVEENLIRTLHPNLNRKGAR